VSTEIRAVVFGVALGFASASLFGFAIGSNLTVNIVSLAISIAMFFVAKERNQDQ
jgi:uncharacterized membrane protein YgaE (UPF0421/DUF939 family)